MGSRLPLATPVHPTSPRATPARHPAVGALVRALIPPPPYPRGRVPRVVFHAFGPRPTLRTGGRSSAWPRRRSRSRARDYPAGLLPQDCCRSNVSSACPRRNPFRRRPRCNRQWLFRGSDAGPLAVPRVTDPATARRRLHWKSDWRAHPRRPLQVKQFEPTTTAALAHLAQYQQRPAPKLGLARL